MDAITFCSTCPRCRQVVMDDHCPACEAVLVPETLVGAGAFADTPFRIPLALLG